MTQFRLLSTSVQSQHPLSGEGGGGIAATRHKLVLIKFAAPHFGQEHLWPPLLLASIYLQAFQDNSTLRHTAPLIPFQPHDLPDAPGLILRLAGIIPLYPG